MHFRCIRRLPLEAAAAALGGGGPWPSLQAWRWCWYGGGSPVLGGCLGGEKFVVAWWPRFPLFIYFSEFPSSDFLASVKWGYLARTDSDWAVLGLKRKIRKLPTTLFLCLVFHLTSFSVLKLTISEILQIDRFQESPIRLKQGFLLRFCQFPSDSYTSKCKTRTLRTFATINRLAQINHKIDIKTSGNDVKHAWNNQKL